MSQVHAHESGQQHARTGFDRAGRRAQFEVVQCDLADTVGRGDQRQGGGGRIAGFDPAARRQAGQLAIAGCGAVGISPAHDQIAIPCEHQIAGEGDPANQTELPIACVVGGLDRADLRAAVGAVGLGANGGGTDCRPGTRKNHQQGKYAVVQEASVRFGHGGSPEVVSSMLGSRAPEVAETI